ncbi:MAG: replication initiation protein [Sulfurimonas sp.]|uniref:replication initiation protein n=1 Tax=Sulfurimonas sp. TaxID=2022749 RepID=UPI002639B5D0|nr:replication initiation protein [Sulfurimonas sp.]MDD5400813.1 replication initiation protein [Sulfurimonas sp.]
MKTIMKANSIIRGRFNNYDLYTARCVNFLYYHAQINSKKEGFDNNKLIFFMIDIREEMGLQRIGNYAKIIERTLKNLTTTFSTDENGTVAKTLPFTPKSSKNKKSEDLPMEIIKELHIVKKHAYICEITLSDEFIELLVKSENQWTKLSLDVVMGFKSFYTLLFYENMKSWAGQEYIKFSLDELNEMFDTSYKNYAPLELIIKRSLKEMALLDGRLDIEVSYHKEKYYKPITFTIKKLIDENARLKAVKINKKRLQEEKESDIDVNALVAKIKNKMKKTK